MSDQIADSHCSQCGGTRRHELLHHAKVPWKENGDQVPANGENDYKLLRCCGCSAVSLQHVRWSSENTDADGNLLLDVRYYPPAVSRREPKWLKSILLALPIDEWQLHVLMKEIYVAAQGDLRTLVAMGVRALLERIMIAKVGDKNTFAANLMAFEAAGFVSKVQREHLDTVLDAGHAAIHRVYRPSPEDIGTLLDITESVVESIYLHSAAVERLQKAIPMRKDKQ